MSLDWIPGDPAPDRPERPSRKCYRHDWSKNTIPSVCLRCGKPYDAVAARRGRTNRSRGNAIERDMGRKLGLRRVGQYGGPDDLAGELFRAQVKSGLAFPERLWAWLQAVPATTGQTRLLVVTDAPGPGRKRRALVVLELDDWADLHGSVAEETA
jgi:hypothetical protein